MFCHAYLFWHETESHETGYNMFINKVVRLLFPMS